ncbi:hypothetical protein [Microvirga sp. Mcv34]|uniref:hypothetical protein n=1 Tax=Microvirga sp. Mcv34 TaxID=2926016 RepID=UPI0021CADA24|nr:hypothetical protein [Microvirga sp. Mcv34]
MFSILRFILIVGTIFYFSPVRQQGEGTAAVEALLTPKKTEPATGHALDADHSGHLESIWKALPESAKQAVVDKVLSTSGLPVSDSTRPSDTLRPEDREPAASRPRT